MIHNLSGSTSISSRAITHPFEGFLLKILTRFIAKYQADIMNSLHIVHRHDQHVRRKSKQRTSRNSFDVVDVCLNLDRRALTRG